MKKVYLTTIIIITVISLPFLFFGISQYILLDLSSGDTLIFAQYHSQLDLDPQMAYDGGSISIIDQVCEGLFRYELNNSEMTPVPNLASDYGIWNDNNTEYTVNLRQGISFHDGVRFDADSVKFTFDRMSYFMNATGNTTLITPQISALSFKNQPIINKTEIVSAYRVKFTLNNPFSAFEQILCFWGLYMLSPASTPIYRPLIPGNDTLIGTGPFIYERTIPSFDTRFDANYGYWRGAPKISRLIFTVVSDSMAQYAGLLSGDLHVVGKVNKDMVQIFNLTKGVKLFDGGPEVSIEYLGMNNNHINQTMRKAISYAFDYDYLINEVVSIPVVRCRSPVPIGIQYANWTLDIPTLNITKARQILIDVNWGGIAGGLDVMKDSDWTYLVENNNPLATYNYTYNPGTKIREDIYVQLVNNLKLIGVKVIPAVMDIYQYFFRLYSYGPYHPDMLELYQMGWGVDYYDARCFLNFLFSNTSVYNSARVNDAELESLMTLADDESDPVKRKRFIDGAQKRIIEEIYPFAWLFVPQIIIGMTENLQGFSYLPGNVWIFRECYFT